MVIIFDDQLLEQVGKPVLSQNPPPECLILVQKRDQLRKQTIQKVLARIPFDSNMIISNPSTVIKSQEDHHNIQLLLGLREIPLFTRAAVVLPLDKAEHLLNQYVDHLKQHIKARQSSNNVIYTILISSNSNENEYIQYASRRQKQTKRWKRLPDDKLIKVGSLFEPYDSDANLLGFACMVQLPWHVPTGLETIVGPLRMTRKLAMQSVALQVFVLHELRFARVPSVLIF